MARFNTTITRGDGTSAPGYIINGKSYYSDGTRINAGDSVIDASGRRWTMGGGTSVPAESLWATGPGKGEKGSSASEYYSKYLADQEQAMRRAREEAERAARIRTESAIAENNAYASKVDERTDRQLQEAYLAAQRAKAEAPQALSALGYTGGMTETSMLDLDAGYQRQRSSLEQERTNALNQIAENARKIRDTGNAELAGLGAQYYNNLISAQQNAQRAAQDQANFQAQFDAQRKREEREAFIDTMGAYHGDYQARINELANDGDSSNDWQIPYLKAKRMEKIGAMQRAEAEAEDAAFDRYIKEQQLAQGWARVNKMGRGGGGRGSGEGNSGYSKTDAYNIEAATILNNNISPAELRANMSAIVSQYGIDKYNQLLEFAEENYKAPPPIYEQLNILPPAMKMMGRYFNGKK